MEGGSVNFKIDEHHTRQLKQIARDEGATLYITLLTVYTVLLYQISGQEDIVVGTPIVGRRHADLEAIIGVFVNALLLRNYPRPDKSFSKFLKEVKQRTLEAFENQEYPFEELVEKRSAVTGRDLSRFALVNAGFGLEKIKDVQEQVLKSSDANLVVKPVPIENRHSKVDVNLVIYEGDRELSACFEYSVKLFKEETIRGFIHGLRQVVNQVTRDPGLLLKDIVLEPVGKLEQVKLVKETASPVRNNILEVEFDL